MWTLSMVKTKNSFQPNSMNNNNGRAKQQSNIISIFNKKTYIVVSYTKS